MAQVSIRKIVKAYEGGVQAVKGIDLEIEDHEFVVLVGPSGCGKSTTLRMIAGLEEITAGEIAIGGKVVNDIPPRDRDIAMVFQNYALYPHMSVFENMAFGLTLRKFPKEEIKRRVDNAARILDITSLLERKPKALSGGQRQRVAMGRAIVRDPQVFLFDEPLSNLDAKLRVAMRTEIKELHQRLKTTSIYVTHDQIEAMTMADKIVVMRDGIVEQTGSPLELYDFPANQFVAGFIGSPAMNFIPGTVKGGQVAFEGGLVLPMPDNARGKAAEGQQVVYGSRPEHIDMASGNEGVPTEVVVVEPTGADTQVFTKIAGVEVTSIFRERHDFRPGATIRLKPDTSRAHLFDAASGKRLAA